MGYTLGQFAGACHRILAEEPGVEGRKKVCKLLEEVLKDESFLAATFNENTSARQVLYEDPELGFCILAHQTRGAAGSPPHDHGPSWAIYGQARGETIMSDWQKVEPATPEKPGKVRLVRSYSMTPGTVHLYNEGDLHSPRRENTTWLIRIEGKNMDKVGRRLAYERVEA